jgi:hypothetical protein
MMEKERKMAYQKEKEQHLNDVLKRQSWLQD